MSVRRHGDANETTRTPIIRGLDDGDRAWRAFVWIPNGNRHQSEATPAVLVAMLHAPIELPTAYQLPRARTSVTQGSLRRQSCRISEAGLYQIHPVSVNTISLCLLAQRSLIIDISNAESQAVDNIIGLRHVQMNCLYDRIKT